MYNDNNTEKEGIMFYNSLPPSFEPSMPYSEPYIPSDYSLNSTPPTFEEYSDLSDSMPYLRPLGSSFGSLAETTQTTPQQQNNERDIFLRNNRRLLAEQMLHIEEEFKTQIDRPIERKK